MFNGYLYNPVGDHTTDATISSATVLTPPVTGTQLLIIQAFTQAIRYTLDGTTPTASTGFRLAANESDVIPVSVDAIVTVIEETASASIQYQWADMRKAQ
jgi:hypothetical protein